MVSTWSQTRIDGSRPRTDFRRPMSIGDRHRDIESGLDENRARRDARATDDAEATPCAARRARGGPSPLSGRRLRPSGNEPPTSRPSMIGCTRRFRQLQFELELFEAAPVFTLRLSASTPGSSSLSSRPSSQRSTRSPVSCNRMRHPPGRPRAPARMTRARAVRVDRRESPSSGEGRARFQ